MRSKMVRIGAAGLLVVAGVALPVNGAAAADGGTASGRYLVQLADAPLAEYTGGIKGLAATKPAAGSKLNAGSAAGTAYRNYLAGRRGGVLSATKVKAAGTMDVAFNGFTARLTGKQAEQLRHTAGVAHVYADRTVKVQSSGLTTSGLTTSMPSTSALNTSGLSTSGTGTSGTGTSGTGTSGTGAGLGATWQRQFGDKTGKNAGSGVIVGVIDTGYTPESPSFAPLTGPRSDQRIIDAKWKGVCDFGDGKPLCNSKVIGARWYNGAGLGEAGYDYLSPRDHDGHGTHTASTAAGAANVRATVGGVDVGTISGVAPGARLAIYKVLWDSAQGEGVGSEIDIVSAIDDAVADGVDVLNYSVGDDSEMWGAADEAFFNAAAAGVFVAAAAGNAGPGDATVDNTTPWVTTVAATEQDHRYVRTITLGNGKTYTGVGFGATGTAAVPLVDSRDAIVDPADEVQRYWGQYCYADTLDPAKVAGRIVLCARGENARVEKADVVKAAGGAGMIMYQPEWDPNTLLADQMAVPSAHVDVATGAALIAYASSGKPTAALSPAKLTRVEAPEMAGFSSSGPSTLLNDSDLLKPDIAAPGVDVVAATSPDLSPSGFTLMSGTSMATPHIAGMAALVKSKHQDWGPTVIRSALMTGATQTTDRGNPIREVDHDANALNYGAGEVNVDAAFDPGLAYESTPADWLAYLCGVSSARGGSVGLSMTDCDSIGSIATSALNYPSVSFGHLLGTQSVTRTVTNVGRTASHYTARVEAPAGYKVTVSPSSFTVKPGRSARFTITVTHAGTGAFDTWTGGGLTWADGQGHRVRIPIILTNTALVAPGSLTASGTSGSLPVSLTTGWSGTLKVGTAGLVSGSGGAFHLTGHTAAWDDTYAGIPSPLPAAMTTVSLHVPAGSVGPAVTVDAQYGRCSDDDDACGDFYAKVFDAHGDYAAAEFMHSPHTATLKLPDGGGDYTLVVEQVEADNQPSGQDYTYTLYTPSAGGSLSVTAPAAVTPGGTSTATLRWSGLSAGTTYHGVLIVGDGRQELTRIPVAVTG